MAMHETKSHNYDMRELEEHRRKKEQSHEPPEFKAGSPEKYESYVEKRIKEKNITDPGDRLVERAKIANEYRKKHGGKLPGGYLEKDK